MSIIYIPTAHGGKRRIRFLETGVTVSVSCNLGAKKYTWILCKNRKYS